MRKIIYNSKDRTFSIKLSPIGFIAIIKSPKGNPLKPNGYKYELYQSDYYYLNNPSDEGYTSKSDVIKDYKDEILHYSPYSELVKSKTYTKDSEYIKIKLEYQKEINNLNKNN